MNLALVTVFCWLLAAASVRADIEVTPLRQVVTSDHRKASFTVSNPSDRILEARVSWIDLTATETGYRIAESAVRPMLSAAPYLNVSPAYFQLEPGARLKVSVWVGDGVTIPQGERRSHLLFETNASRTPIRKASDSGLQVDIDLGVSVPIILRNGVNASAKISDTRLLRDDNGLLLLSTSIIPTGDISTYGRIAVSFKLPDASQRAQILGVRHNVAGFLDASARTVEVPLGHASLVAGTLTVRYEGAAEFQDTIFDERIFDISPP